MKGEKVEQKKKIIADKFSLLETILIGFFYDARFVESGVEWKKKLCHSVFFF